MTGFYQRWRLARHGTSALVGFVLIGGALVAPRAAGFAPGPPQSSNHPATSDSRSVLPGATHVHRRSGIVQPKSLASLTDLPPVLDNFGPVVTLKTATGEFVSPVHATLLPDGRLLLIGGRRVVETPTAVDFGAPATYVVTTTRYQQEPLEVVVSLVNVPYELNYPGLPFGEWKNVYDSLFCSGHSLMADGTVFSAGGTRFAKHVSDQFHIIKGLPYASTFSHLTNSAARIPRQMLGVGSGLPVPARWYPTVTRLPDGRMLVTGGSDLVTSQKYHPNLSAEVYDPSSQAWEILSQHGDTPPAIWNPNYTHVFPLPTRTSAGHDLLMFGSSGEPVFMSLSNAPHDRWRVSGKKRPDTQPDQTPSLGASTTLLPFRISDGEWGYANGSVLVAGGLYDTSHEHSIDVYGVASDTWIRRIDMRVRRHHPSTVILPDGRIAVIAGQDISQSTDVGVVEYVDPRNGFSLARGTASMPETRGYHVVSLLLPDGRVLVGGGNDDDNPGHEKPNFRYYEPDYMTLHRPALNYAPPSIKGGKHFGVLWDKAAEISEAVLIGLGSMTHSFDMNQRSIQLRVSGVGPSQYGTNRWALLEAPGSAALAPPGHYMLFLLDQDRVPSEAKIVKLEY